MNKYILKGVNTQKQEGSAESTRELEQLVKECHHEVNGHWYPDLGLHLIGAGTEVMFDTEVALDQLEEEFDLPTALVELGNGENGNLQVVGEEDKMPSYLHVVVAHPVQRIQEVGRCFEK
jgi:hypothetical protein